MNLNLYGLWNISKSKIVVSVLIGCFCTFYSFPVWGQEDSEKKSLSFFFSQLGDSHWEKREQAFQQLLKWEPSVEFETLLKQSLASSDAEIQNFAEQLRLARLFWAPPALIEQCGPIFSNYSTSSVRHRQEVLETLKNQGGSLSLGLLLKILQYDASLDIRQSAFEFLTELLFQYEPKELAKNISFYFFSEPSFWLDYVYGELQCRQGKLMEAVPFFTSAYNRLRTQIREKIENRLDLDPTENYLQEELEKNLALLALNTNDFVSAQTYLQKAHFSSFIGTELYFSFSEFPEEKRRQAVMNILRSLSSEDLEKLALLFFLQENVADSFFFFKEILTLHPESLFLQHSYWHFLEKHGTTAQKIQFAQQYYPVRLTESVPPSLLQFFLQQRKTIFEPVLFPVKSSHIWFFFSETLRGSSETSVSALSVQAFQALLPLLKDERALYQHSEPFLEMLWNLGKASPEIFMTQQQDIPPLILSRWIPSIALFPSGETYLSGFLEHDASEVLTSAIGYLGFFRKHEDASRLHSFLKHPDPQVRRFTAQALGQIKSPESLPFLLERLQEEEEEDVLACLLSELKHFSFEPSQIPWTLLFESSSAEVLKSVVSLLPLEESLRFVAHPEENVRREVIKKLGKAKSLPFLTFLENFLNDKEDAVFEEVLEFLLNWPEAEDHFLPILQKQEAKETDPLRKRYLRQVLWELGQQEYLAFFLEDFQSKEEDIQKIALAVLGEKVMKPEIFPSFEFCLKASSSEIRTQALSLLKGHSEPYVLDWLKRLAFDPHHHVQFQAVQALVFLEQSELAPLITLIYQRLLYEFPDHSVYQLAWTRWLITQKKYFRAQLEAEWTLRWNKDQLEAHQILLWLSSYQDNRLNQEKECHWIESYYQEKFLEQPENPILMNDFAWILGEANVKLETALFWIDQALQRLRDPHFLDTKAEIVKNLGKKEEAVLLLQEALQKAETPVLKLYLQRRLELFLKK